MIMCPPVGLESNRVADDHCAITPRNIPKERV